MGHWGWGQDRGLGLNYGAGAMIIRAGTGPRDRGWGGATGAGNGAPLAAVLSLLLLGLWEGVSWALLTALWGGGWGQVWIGGEVVVRGCIPCAPWTPCPLCHCGPGRFGAVEGSAGALRLYTVQVPHKRERRPPPCYLTKWDGKSFLPLLTRPCGSEVVSCLSIRYPGAGGYGLGAMAAPAHYPPPVVIRAPSWGWAQ